MKKLLSQAMVCALVFLATSCGFKSTETPLHGNLVTFTAIGENKDDILIGVKEKSTDGIADRVLITPAHYQEITSDGDVIICKVADMKLEVYHVSNGNPIGSGKFELFTKIPSRKAYIGTKYKTVTYYFPENGKTIVTQNRLESLKNLFVKNGDVWEVLDYDGNLIWQAPALIWLIKDSKASVETFYIAIPGEKKNSGCTIYDINGKQLKKLTASRWSRAQKNLKNIKPFGSDNEETSSYAEVDGLNSL